MTDVLAQKREEAAQPAAVPSPAQTYWSSRLTTPEGRAALFAELVDASLFAEPPAPATDRDIWFWLGNRSRAARILAEAIEVAPLAVGSMWSEAMKRQFEQMAGK